MKVNHGNNFILKTFIYFIWHSQPQQIQQFKDHQLVLQL